MIKRFDKKLARQKRHKRIRNKISGTGTTPRLCVYKSLHHIYAQLINDEQGVTLTAASTLEKDMQDLESKTNIEAAKRVGKKIAEKANEQGIKTVVFDRNGNRYHGCIVALADAARKGGLEF